MAAATIRIGTLIEDGRVVGACDTMHPELACRLRQQRGHPPYWRRLRSATAGNLNLVLENDEPAPTLADLVPGYGRLK